MDISLVNTISIALAGVFSSCIAFLVYLGDRQNKINQFFFLFTASLASYLTFGYLSYSPDQISSALLWKKVFFSFITFFFIFVYFFSVYFPREGKRNFILDKIVLISEAIFLLLLLFTDKIIRDVRPEPWGTDVVFGPAKIIWFLATSAFTLLVLGQIISKYLALSKKEQPPVLYFLIGTIIFAAVNLIFNIIYPLFWNTYRYHYIGDYTAVFFFILTAYAIVRKQLFNMKILLTESLVVGFFLLLFTQLIFGNFIPAIFTGLADIVLFFPIGYMLIAASHKEVRRSEIFEQKVQERTKELELNKKVAEERTKELEKWYNLTLGRESRMAELKTKIKELEEKEE